MQPTFPQSADDDRDSFLLNPSEAAAPQPSPGPNAPFRMRLPDLNEPAGEMAGVEYDPASTPASPIAVAVCDGDEAVVVAELVEPTYSERLRRSTRGLTSQFVNFASSRGRGTSVVACGAILATAAVLLVMVLTGDDLSQGPIQNDAPPKWTQADSAVEWTQNTVKLESTAADAEQADETSSQTKLAESKVNDAAQYCSAWPRESDSADQAVDGGNRAAANSPARVATLQGTIEPTTENNKRR